MQAGEVIWFLAGVGVGLTVAMGLFAVMAFFDGRKSRAGSAAADAVPEREEPSPLPPRKVAPVPEPMPRVPPEEVRRAARPIAPLSPEPAVEPLAPVTKPSDLAIEIARVQAAEVEQIIELPPAEPVHVVAEPTPPPQQEALPPPPEPEPEVSLVPSPQAENPTGSALAQLVAPQEPVVAPKMPPLPKVTPARKFAPALPPRDKT